MPQRTLRVRFLRLSCLSLRSVPSPLFRRRQLPQLSCPILRSLLMVTCVCQHCLFVALLFWLLLRAHGSESIFFTHPPPSPFVQRSNPLARASCPPARLPDRPITRSLAGSNAHQPTHLPTHLPTCSPAAKRFWACGIRLLFVQQVRVWRLPQSVALLRFELCICHQHGAKVSSCSSGCSLLKPKSSCGR